MPSINLPPLQFKSRLLVREHWFLMSEYSYLLGTETLYSSHTFSFCAYISKPVLSSPTFISRNDRVYRPVWDSVPRFRLFLPQNIGENKIPHWPPPTSPSTLDYETVVRCKILTSAISLNKTLQTNSVAHLESLFSLLRSPLEVVGRYNRWFVPRAAARDSACSDVGMVGAC